MKLPKTTAYCDSIELAKKLAKFIARPIVVEVKDVSDVLRVHPNGRVDNLSKEYNELMSRGISDSKFGSQTEAFSDAKSKDDKARK